MAFEQKEMQAIMVVDPARAKQMILDALASTGVHIGNASKSLGCNRITLTRWIVKLDLGAAVEAMKTQAIADQTYEARKGGRPKGTTVSAGAAPRGTHTKLAAKKRTSKRAKSKRPVVSDRSDGRAAARR